MEALEKELIKIIKQSFGESVRKHMDDYGSPLKTMVFDALKVHEDILRSFLYEAVSQTLLDEDFRQQAKLQIKHKVAKELTSTFGEGIFKRTIEQLKSDPTLKARCILAVESIIEHAKDAEKYEGK